MATWPGGEAVTEQDIVWQWIALRFAGLEAGELQGGLAASGAGQGLHTGR